MTIDLEELLMQMLSLENNPKARLLARLMSDLSEEHWCAGWLTGTEYALWADLTERKVCGESGWNIAASEKEELQVAQTLANGWIVWSEELQAPAFVSTTEWLAHLAKREAARNDLDTEPELSTI